MLKRILLACLIAIPVFGAIGNDVKEYEDAIAYQKKEIVSNPYILLHSIEVVKMKELKNNWKHYTFLLDITNRKNNKREKTYYPLYTNGEYYTHSLSHKSYAGKDLMEYIFDRDYVFNAKYYTKDRLIIGDGSNKNKLVIFSDPLCPYCTRNLPSIFSAMNKKGEIDVYYVDFPLSFHKNAKDVIRAIKYAKEKGVKNPKEVVYGYLNNKVNLRRVSALKTKKELANNMSKVLGISITEDNLSNPKYDKEINDDLAIVKEAKIGGTPGFIFNGSKLDASKKMFQYMKSN